MPRPRNTEAAYAPAIAALRVDLADLERRAAETRALPATRNGGACHDIE